MMCRFKIKIKKEQDLVLYAHICAHLYNIIDNLILKEKERACEF